MDQMMESNRKRKARERNLNPEQIQYYKKLRKEQNKRRKQRKREASKQAELKPKEKIQVTDSRTRVRKESNEKKEVEEFDRRLPRGKQMVSAALKSGSLHSHRSACKFVAGPAKTSRQELAKGTGAANFKELHFANLKRNTGALSIGSGTYGTCYPGKYRGIPVVIKEYKKISRAGGKSADSLSQIQKEARHEARIISQLPDHPGLPLERNAHLHCPKI